MRAVKNSLLILLGTILALAAVFLFVAGVAALANKEIAFGIFFLTVGAIPAVLAVICFRAIRTAGPSSSATTTTPGTSISVATHSTPSERRYYITKDGQKFGPLSAPEVQARINSRDFRRTDLVWYQDAEHWTPLSSILDFSFGHVPPPSPPPPPSPHPAKPFPRAATIAILCFASLLASMFISILSGHGAQPVAFTIGEAIGNALAYLLFAIPVSLVARGYTSLVLGLVVIAVLAEIVASVRLFTH
jgi:hypothetical protein